MTSRFDVLARHGQDAFAGVVLPGPLGGARHLREIADVGPPPGRGTAHGLYGRDAARIASVTSGGQEPVQQRGGFRTGASGS
ncbi:hypothetical protein ACFCYB_37825 [Streptomyces sp. NPDC056309]|uniref:hypothetical protein n=1 Tax=unclassified Streptomyces TaxID=2593676 RepID=UPI0035DDF8A8